MPTWGGRRPGAGRPPKGPRSSEPHKQRVSFRAHEPLRVTMELEPDTRRLRARELEHALREATLCAARRDDVRIVYVRAAGGTLELLVEAQHKTALARGMQAFQISAARHINAALSRRRSRRRKGRVFSDRYRVEILRAPRMVRRALEQAQLAPPNSDRLAQSLVVWTPRTTLLRRLWPRASPLASSDSTAT